MARTNGRLAGTTLAEKLLLNSVRNQDGCLIWQGAHTPSGYGQVAVRRRGRGVHRISYNLFVSEIPDGLEIDHLRRVRDCIEPSHLEPVTHAENLRRMFAVITHCPQRHEYTEENTIWTMTKRGHAARRCRKCKNAGQRALRARRRAELGGMSDG